MISRAFPHIKKVYVYFFIIALLYCGTFLVPLFIPTNGSIDTNAQITTIKKTLSEFLDNETDIFNKKTSAVKTILFSESEGKLTNNIIFERINRLSSSLWGIYFEIYNSNNQLFAWKNITDTAFVRNLNYSKRKFSIIKNKSILYSFKVDSINVNGQKFTAMYYRILDKNYIDENNNTFTKLINSKNKLNASVFVISDNELTNTQLKLLHRVNNDIFFSVNNNYNKAADNFFEKINFIRLLLLFSFFLIVTIKLFKSLDNVESDFYKFCLLFILLFAFRYLLNLISFPAALLNGDIVNPAIYSTNFGFGILKSPFELRITIFFVLIYLIILLRFVVKNNFSITTKKRKLVLFLLLLFLWIEITSLYYFVDSLFVGGGIKYFKIIDVIPNFISFFMLFNILLFGFNVLLAILITSLLIYKNYLQSLAYAKWIMIFVFILMLSINALLLRNSLDIYTNAALTASLYFLSRYVYKTTFNKVAFYIYLSLCASFIMIIKMGSISSNAEKHSAKVAYLEYTRINQSWIKFLIQNNLKSIQTDYLEKKENIDFKNEAFEIWNKSQIKSENLISEFYFLDSLHNYIDGVNFSFPYGYSKNWAIEDSIYNGKIDIDKIPNSFDEIISGVVCVDSIRKFYLGITVKYNKFSYNVVSIPQIIIKDDIDKSNIVNIKDFEIITLLNNRIINNSSNINPTITELEDILKNKKKEYFTNVKINDEEYEFYVNNHHDESGKSTYLFGYRKSNYSWFLYDFVRIFLFHVAIILLVLSFYLLIIYLRNKEIKFNYQARILTIFLFITLVPLLILAVFFRNVNTLKIDDNFRIAMSRDIDKISLYLEKYSYYSVGNLRDIIIKANNDLGLNFTLYKNDRVKFSTFYDYYYFGNLPKIINHKVYFRMVLQNAEEQHVTYRINAYPIKASYKKIELNGEEYILELSDLTNSNYVSINSAEMDLFIFGSYGFAVIVIILLIVLLTNKISYPIIRLTEVTKKVAKGDLNIKLILNEKGEIAELVDGFNQMVSELKVAQEELAVKEREAAWREMAKQVAHEIKNPLTPMKLSVQLLEQAYKDKSPQFGSIFEKVINTVIKQIDILKNIASEFSVVAKFPSTKIEKIVLLDILNEVIKLYSGDNLAFEINCSSVIEEFRFDSEQLRRILINLIKNSKEAGATLIKFNVEQSSDDTILYVIDNGRGIEESIHNKIFEDKFTTKSEGMGIGLFLTKTILNAFNSNIELEKSDKTETIFKIILKRDNQ